MIYLHLELMCCRIQGEKNKLQEIAMLACLGREALEQDNKGKLIIEGVGKADTRRRGLGRLITWCKGHFGRSAFQREHDTRWRKGKRPAAFRDDEGGVGEEEAEPSTSQHVEVEEEAPSEPEPEEQDLGNDEEGEVTESGSFI
jgi:hypothetical protein